MPWNNITTYTTGQLATAAVWEDMVENMNYLEEVAYQEFVNNVTVSATTAAAADTIVSAGAVTYEAVPHLIEFYTSRISTPATASAAVLLALWDGSTNLGRIGVTQTTTATGVDGPAHVMHRLTPTAASHTYIIKAHRVNANGTVYGGAGGVDTTLPGFIRVTRIPV